MATLTLVCGTGGEDAMISDLSYDDTQTIMTVGAVGTGPLTNFGQGWRFTAVTLAAADTINNAAITLMKDPTQWSTMSSRWQFEAADNAAAFSSGSPPGSRTGAGSIAAEAPNVNEILATRYTHPSTSGLRITLGASLALVTARAGWASGNAVALLNNPDTDASAVTGTSRKNFRTGDFATPATNAPNLVIDYTAGAAASPFPPWLRPQPSLMRLFRM